MMKLSFAFFCFTFIIIEISGQIVSKTMKRLPDTGQKLSYTNTFGEDNDYTINAPYFIDNGNGTINDTITGMMWQKTDGGEMTIENARIYCDSLTLGGYTDWRLPNPHEAFSILNHQYNNPALDNIFFIKTVAEYWWTNLTQFNDISKIWCTNAGGGIGNHPKNETISAGGTKKFHVRAVRDIKIPETIPNHFTDNGDGTISDNLTGLIWQKIININPLTWEDALIYSENLSLAGKSDWRLPNIKELQSLNDESTANPSVNSNYFSNLGVKKYWSSTSLPNQTNKAWFWDTQFGITTYDLKTNANYLLCVRSNSGPNNSNPDIEKHGILKIYPNPFHQFIHIDKHQTSQSFQLYSAYGQLVYEGKEIELYDFSELLAGIYFLKVIDTKNSVYQLIKF